MTTPAQNADERRLAERYLQVLDDVSRCAKVVRDGDWQSLTARADELSRHAAQLAQAAERHNPEAPPKACGVVEIVMSRHGDSQVALALHPRSPVTDNTAMATNNPFSHSIYTTGR